MSLTASPVKAQFDLSGGAAASYPFSFKFWSTAEVNAVLSTASGDVALAEGVDYSVSSPGDSGTLTRLSTWPAATRLTIYRELDLSQGTDLVNGATQNAEVYETMVDRAVAVCQQIDEKTDRIVRFPITDPAASPDMPSSEDRASKFLAFDASGNPIPVASGLGAYPVTPFAAEFLDDTSVLEAQKTLGILGGGASAVIGSSVQAVLGSSIASAAKTMLETGDIAGMEADAEDVDYANTDLVASTVKDAVDAIVASAFKDFITGTGLSYDKTNLSTLLKRASRFYGQRVGAICEFEDKFSPDADNPYLCLDADADILAANWPPLVTHLREIKLIAGGASSWAYTASGGVMTLSGTGMASLLADLAEDNQVHGSFTNWLTCTVAGVDYVLTAVTPGSNQITVSVTPPASGTVEFYVHRVPNDTTKARVFKDQGRATYSHDGATYLAGLRRRDRGQGHSHGALIPTANAATYAGGGASIGPSGAIVAPTTDGTNGTPRTGPTTDAANSVKFRFYFGGIYLP